MQYVNFIILLFSRWMDTAQDVSFDYLTIQFSKVINKLFLKI